MLKILPTVVGTEYFLCSGMTSQPQGSNPNFSGQVELGQSGSNIQVKFGAELVWGSGSFGRPNLDFLDVLFIAFVRCRLLFIGGAGVATLCFPFTFI